jgi:aspartate/methionine/tyrosine aminotransferase
VWPNVVEQPRILGAAVTRVALRARDGDWQLDLDRLYAALTPQTRAVVINSPNNPTGWVISRDEQRAILQHCRRHGIWIIADEVYERLIFDGSRCAPSFLDIADASDRLIVTNTFSKSWLMTGWRLGWLVSPRGADGRTLLDDLANVIEYNYSCVPGFVQRGGVAAIRHGEETTRAFVGRLAAARDFLLRELGRLPEIEVTRPAGAMYAFFRVPSADSLALAKSLVREAGLGLAPGIAFGAEGEGYLRWCFASSLDRLAIGLERFTRYLGRKK